ncbi:hypothetical protein V501_00501 [Pseudogymnoascus sp. VKM F-4519 (FW-2642)]|nr:hypothetical protein V501_00501 [Pseudogymnoascus sp. VKM F-4519 (FW-2642)]
MPPRRGQGPAKSTPLKRPASQIAGSLESSAPETPTTSGATAKRPRVTRPYRSPTVQDGPEESNVPRPAATKPVGMRTVLGWKVAARRVVPEDLGPVRAGSRACCVKCAHTYYNFPGQMCWTPSGLDKCADCAHGNNDCVMVDPQFGDHLKVLQLAADILLDSQADDDEAGLEDDSPATTQALKALAEAQRTFTNTVRAKESATPKGKGAAGPSKAKEVVATPSKSTGPTMVNVDYPCQALLHYVETLAILGKAKTEDLKAAAQVFNTSVTEVLDAFQSRLEDHVNTLKLLVVIPKNAEMALLERTFVKPSKWRYNVRSPVPSPSPKVEDEAAGPSGSPSGDAIVISSDSSSSSSEPSSSSSSSPSGQGSSSEADL